MWTELHSCGPVCMCVHITSCSIQGLTYTRVVLSPYLYLSSFSFSCCIFLPLSALLSIHSKYLFSSEESYTTFLYRSCKWRHYSPLPLNRLTFPQNGITGNTVFSACVLKSGMASIRRYYILKPFRGLRASLTAWDMEKDFTLPYLTPQLGKYN